MSVRIIVILWATEGKFSCNSRNGTCNHETFRVPPRNLKNRIKNNMYGTDNITKLKYCKVIRNKVRTLRFEECSTEFVHLKIFTQPKYCLWEVMCQIDQHKAQHHFEVEGKRCSLFQSLGAGTLISGLVLNQPGQQRGISRVKGSGAGQIDTQQYTEGTKQNF